MGYDTIGQICEFLTRRGYAVDPGRAPVTAVLDTMTARQVLCIKVVENGGVRIWISFKCPVCSDRLKLLETTNRLNMLLAVSCAVTLIEMDTLVLVGACFPYAFEETVFNTFFSTFLEDARQCMEAVKAAVEENDDGKAVIRL
jgi:hypothetical protein